LFNYEKLEVWREAIGFADTIYRVTRSFPSEEKFGLVNQMRRAAVSVSSNIAEGSSRNLRNDFARFVEIATGSVFEVASQAHLAQRQGFLSDEDFQTIPQHAAQIGRMLSGLRKNLKESK